MMQQLQMQMLLQQQQQQQLSASARMNIACKSNGVPPVISTHLTTVSGGALAPPAVRASSLPSATTGSSTRGEKRKFDLSRHVSTDDVDYVYCYFLLHNYLYFIHTQSISNTV